MATSKAEELIPAPSGYHGRAIVWSAVLLATASGGGLWCGTAVVGLAGFVALVGLGGWLAQCYARAWILSSGEVQWQGPLWGGRLSLRRINKVRVCRRFRSTQSLGQCLAAGEVWLPPHWPGVALMLDDGRELFVPTTDAHGLARRLLRLQPAARWDRLSEKDYFEFLAGNLPQAWPRLTKSFMPSASTRAIGCGPSRSVHPR